VKNEDRSSPTSWMSGEKGRCRMCFNKTKQDQVGNKLQELVMMKIREEV
jgi:hypothetical protein